MKTRIFLSFITSTTLFIGCAQQASDSAPVTKNHIIESAKEKPNIPIPVDSIPEPTGIIALKDAIAYALVNNPSMQTYWLDAQIAEAQIEEAKLLANPKLELETEEFGGTKGKQGFDDSMSTIRFGQLIELAGKRSKRVRFANAKGSLAQLDYQANRLDVMTSTTQAFLNVLTAQKQLELAKELMNISTQATTLVDQKVAAGAGTRIEQSKANIALANTQLILAKAKGKLNVARHTLASAWGRQIPRFETAKGAFYEIMPVPAIANLKDKLAKTPKMTKWAFQKDKYKAGLAIEKAKRIPDVTIQGGLQQWQADDSRAFVVSLSLPLPIWNRNQAAIRQSALHLAQVDHQERLAQIQLENTLHRAIQALTSSYTEATSLKNNILPNAKGAFDAVSEGYRKGQYNYLSVLDAQRTLFKAQEQYIDALANYHQTNAIIERMIGQSLK